MSLLPCDASHFLQHDTQEQILLFFPTAALQVFDKHKHQTQLENPTQLDIHAKMSSVQILHKDIETGEETVVIVIDGDLIKKHSKTVRDIIDSRTEKEVVNKIVLKGPEYDALKYVLEQIVEAVDDRQPHQGVGHHGAGHVALLVPAHAVGHRPQAAVGADQQRILIDLAAKADVGPADAFKSHACSPADASKGRD